jgi:hypothetical protein
MGELVSGAVMDYYREVLADDPFRRSEREREAESADENDKGDLFGLRRRARHLRILVDRESLMEPSSAEEIETHQILEALTRRQGCIEVLSIDMSKMNDPDDNDRTPDVVHLRDYTAHKGWASLPGPQYGYRIVYSTGTTVETNGNISPQPQLFQNLFGL